MVHTKRLEEGGGMHHFREALAQVVREVVEFPPGAFVTVVDAKITRDTKNAKGILSVMPVEMEGDVLKILKQSEHDIKEGLAENLRLRRIPRLHWGFDHTEDFVGSIDDTINQLKAKGEL
jgi:ribosome-binding factor A